MLNRACDGQYELPRLAQGVVSGRRSLNSSQNSPVLKVEFPAVCRQLTVPVYSIIIITLYNRNMSKL